jgi:hypothetical protein
LSERIVWEVGIGEKRKKKEEEDELKEDGD